MLGRLGSTGESFLGPLVKEIRIVELQLPDVTIDRMPT